MSENNFINTVYMYSATRIDGTPVPISMYRGKVLLIVNVASNCGFTWHYKGLQELYDKYKDKGLEILGFPCNQFANQEPGSNEEISNFCKVNYGVTFPLFEKINVNGDDAHPLYKFLSKAAPGILGSKMIKWNFTKFLVNKNGIPIKRFASSDKPEKLVADIEKLLAE